MPITFFSETPLIQQLAPSIAKDVVLMLNRFAQVLALTAALIGIFPEQVRSAITSVTELIIYLIKGIVHAIGYSWRKSGPALEIGPEYDPSETDDDIFGNHDLSLQIRVALVLALALIAESYVDWSWVPSLWEYGSKIATVWSDVHLTFSSVSLTLIESLARLVTWPPFALAKLIGWFLYVVAWLVVIWGSASCISAIIRALTETSFRWVMALMLLFAGLLQIFTT